MVDNIIYQFWTGNNPITENRKKCLLTSSNFKVDHKLITPQELMEYQHKDYPFHPALQYLSENHKSDYFRCYFMHIYGGGYADIKSFSQYNNWKQCFDLINKDEGINIIGQKETIGGSPLENLNNTKQIHKVLSNGFFIVRKQTEFTERWFNEVNRILDYKFNILKSNPSTDIFGQNENYPLRWAELCGEIMHKIEFDFYYINRHSVNDSLNTGVEWGVNWR